MASPRVKSGSGVQQCPKGYVKVSVTVKDKTDDKPIHRAWVRVAKADDRKAKKKGGACAVKTNDQGQAFFSVKKGTYYASVTADRTVPNQSPAFVFKAEESADFVLNKDDHPLELKLERVPPLVLKLVGADGNKLEYERLKIAFQGESPTKYLEKHEEALVDAAIETSTRGTLEVTFAKPESPPPTTPRKKPTSDPPAYPPPIAAAEFKDVSPKPEDDLKVVWELTILNTLDTLKRVSNLGFRTKPHDDALNTASVKAYQIKYMGKTKQNASGKAGEVEGDATSRHGV